MKTFYFNIQAKGGAGKSMLTYLQALKHEKDDKVYFVDFDSSVSTSLQQLKFLQGRNPSRFATMSLLDAREKLDRQLLFENLLELSQKDYEAFYLDFGAPEPDQLPNLFFNDYTIEEFKQIQDELDAQFIFNIVVAGGGAYKGCTAYLQRMTKLVKGMFTLNIYINQATFSGTPYLINELKDFASIEANKINNLKLFGNFDTTAAPHISLLQKIGEGQGMEAFVFVEAVNIKRELLKI